MPTVTKAAMGWSDPGPLRNAGGAGLVGAAQHASFQATTPHS